LDEDETEIFVRGYMACWESQVAKKGSARVAAGYEFIRNLLFHDKPNKHKRLMTKGQLIRITICVVMIGLAVGVLMSNASPLKRNPPGNWSATGAPKVETAVHASWGSSDAIDWQGDDTLPARTELESSLVQTAPATRSSFMATWAPVPGAKGYRLDVSTSARFDSYVDGYRDLDVGNATGRVVAGVSQGMPYYYRVRAYGVNVTGANSPVISAAAAVGSGLIINATFDSSITSNPNAAGIEAAINRAIAIYESLFSDPITVPILFRYSATGPDGSPLGSRISQSDFVVYFLAWDTYINALRADAKTTNDASAIASLPASPLSSEMKVPSATGRAVGLNTPPDIAANGAVGGPYDGIVTINASVPFLFTRPANSSDYDAQRSIEHEMDEVLGFGSFINRDSDLRPQDLFSWSSAGVRNLTANGTRYFSINGGRTGVVYFNQDSRGDFGDWSSGPCPQTTPYVQNAFGCAGQAADITPSSPEGINLDVIGYDLAGASASASQAVVADFNGDGKPDYVLYNLSTRQTAVWYLNNNIRIGSAYGPTVPAGWSLVAAADFDGDGRPDYVLLNSRTGQTAIWYLSGVTFRAGAYGPTLPAGWRLVATGDFNGDTKPDYVLYNPSSHQTAIWYLNNNALISTTYSVTLPAGWSVAGVADFDRDGELDFLLFDPGTQQSGIWYLSGPTFVAAAVGPSVASGYELAATADFNRDSKPDYLLYNAGTMQSAIWYLDNNAFTGGAAGPTLPAGWSLTTH
jgi:FG-GAP-like repeat